MADAERVRLVQDAFWRNEKLRRRLQLAEDMARRDPVWAEKMARRHAEFNAKRAALAAVPSPSSAAAVASEEKATQRQAEFAARIPVIAAQVASEVCAAIAAEVKSEVSAAIEAAFRAARAEHHEDLALAPTTTTASIISTLALAAPITCSTEGPGGENGATEAMTATPGNEGEPDLSMSVPGTDCSGRAAVSAVSTLVRAASSTPPTVSVAIVPERVACIVSDTGHNTDDVNLATSTPSPGSTLVPDHIAEGDDPVELGALAPSKCSTECSCVEVIAVAAQMPQQVFDPYYQSEQFSYLVALHIRAMSLQRFRAPFVHHVRQKHVNIIGGVQQLRPPWPPPEVEIMDVHTQEAAGGWIHGLEIAGRILLHQLGILLSFPSSITVNDTSSPCTKWCFVSWSLHKWWPITHCVQLANAILHVFSWPWVTIKYVEVPSQFSCSPSPVNCHVAKVQFMFSGRGQMNENSTCGTSLKLVVYHGYPTLNIAYASPRRLIISGCSYNRTDLTLKPVVVQLHGTFDMFRILRSTSLPPIIEEPWDPGVLSSDMCTNFQVELVPKWLESFVELQPCPSWKESLVVLAVVRTTFDNSHSVVVPLRIMGEGTIRLQYLGKLYERQYSSRIILMSEGAINYGGSWFQPLPIRNGFLYGHGSEQFQWEIAWMIDLGYIAVGNKLRLPVQWDPSLRRSVELIQKWMVSFSLVGLQPWTSRVIFLLASIVLRIASDNCSGIMMLGKVIGEEASILQYFGRLHKMQVCWSIPHHSGSPRLYYCFPHAQTLGAILIYYLSPPLNLQLLDFSELHWQHSSCKHSLYESLPWYIAWLLVVSSCARTDFGASGNLTSMCVMLEMVWPLDLVFSASGNNYVQLFQPTMGRCEAYIDKRNTILQPFSTRTVQVSLLVIWSRSYHAGHCGCNHLTSSKVEAKERRNAAPAFHGIEQLYIGEDYFLGISLEEIHAVCYLNLKVCLDYGTHRDLGEVMKHQVPWDPGGSTWHRLEVKPKIKEGGMLATILYYRRGLTMRCLYWAWASRKQREAAATYTRGLDTTNSAWIRTASASSLLSPFLSCSSSVIS